MNEELLNMLTLIATNEQSLGNVYKSRAYLKAVEILTVNVVHSGEDAKKFKGIGNSISKDIDEYIKTGCISRLSSYNSCTEDSELSNISGIGPVKISKLAKIGIKTVDDLREAYNSGKFESELNLTSAQIIGLKYYDDFMSRIPYDEATELWNVVKEVLDLAIEIDDTFIADICGSYRRGLETCGDIDILISNSSGENYIYDIVNILINNNFITDVICWGDKKFSGVCRLNENSKFRRIDIRDVDYDSYYFCLLYFTGSKENNIKMRNRAIELGLRLNEYSLTGEEVYKCGSEKEIFDLLQLDYLEPHER